MQTLQERIDAWLAEVRAEVTRAMQKHPCNCTTAHHHFAVLKEEVDELWDCVKTDVFGAERNTEAVQVGAMAVRFLVETNRS